MNSLQHSTPAISWPDVVIAAAASHESFEDVTIVTARSSFADLAMEAAADICVREGHTLSEEKVLAVAQALITGNKIEVRESVCVNAGVITACINVPSTEAEDVPWKALEMVASALDQLNGHDGVVVFSDSLRFTLAEVPWLLKRL